MVAKAVKDKIKVRFIFEFLLGRMRHFGRCLDAPEPFNEFDARRRKR